MSEVSLAVIIMDENERKRKRETASAVCLLDHQAYLPILLPTVSIWH
jgi:hypothetical protein